MRKNVNLLMLLFCFSIGFLTAQNTMSNDINGVKYAENANLSPDIWKPLANPDQKSTTDFGEGFDDITSLAGDGWAFSNNSLPLGATGWFQGNDAVFSAYDGATTAYIGVNFNSVAGSNTISNWMFSPELTLQNGDSFSFYTRTVSGSGWPDRLQVRMSINGGSIDVGATATSVGDFNILLDDINSNYDMGGFPEVWTQYTYTVTGLVNGEQGRFALRYFVENGGPSGVNSNYIGLDRVEFIEAAPVPVSNWSLIIALALIGGFIVIKSKWMS
ncbi:MULTISPECIES: choice-of-anchor J domain-containing protein [unclassified Lentimicrobium]|uniref:choice-of-anchor J domain-containing protein n=1 Tax=unclassified Lentimicrobium TaxID=2677434 RepID=UPI001555C19E|nr:MULTISPECIES: choice-of-anchor J domain-containing protein [unclassified Lentimicrobium]NPD46709.1 PEP-CTERM sorting domain-containing protein [Lentimicrobium sp. S6]NPD85515.1 PEP-CTERM sorting domain-containing protein [Lentimicrobium sp. L6]